MELKKCPFCGGEVKTKIGLGMLTYFYCTNSECGAIISFNGMKKISQGVFQAENPIENFNSRATPQNNPLTLEELMIRDGKAVWVKPLWIDEAPMQELVFIGNGTRKKVHCDYGSTLYFEDYGITWLAYDHEPEEGK